VIVRADHAGRAEVVTIAVATCRTEGPMSAQEPTDNPPQLWLLRASKAVVVLVYAFVLIDLVLLTLGFFLRLFGASTDAEFTRWVYRNVDRVMEPFRGMFPTRAVSEHSVLDVSLLFAMIVYAIIGIALHALVDWLTGRIVEQRRRQERAARQRFIADQELARQQFAAQQELAARQRGQAVPPTAPMTPGGPGYEPPPGRSG
jgi:uncharacterized protein YggT (Ycf19 family)